MLNKKWLILITAGFAIGFLGVYFVSSFYHKSNPETPSDLSNTSGAVEVSWETLRELDLDGKEHSKELKNINGAKVKIPGFLIPLEDNQEDISEFLLVPSPMACIHVPPPPPNQTVFVKMASGRRAPMPYAPIWVYGRLRIAESHGPYGKVSYSLTGERTEPY